MEHKNIILNSTKTLLNNEITNDIFLSLDILLLRDEPNLNKFHFTEAFIDEIVANNQKYNGLPIVCDTKKILSKDYLNLGHNMSPTTGKFYSEQIGSYVSFSKQYGEDGVAELHGTARISKRNADLVDVLMEMHETIGLNFSVEVAASEYSIDESNILTIGASDKNYLFSDALVSFPACPESQALKLVAELNNSLKGNEENVKKDLLSELSHDDIRSQISKEINPNFDENGWRIYDYWLVSVFDDYFIVNDEKNQGVYYKFNYIIENDEVKLGEKSQVTINFVTLNEEGGNKKMENTLNELMKEKEALLLENAELKTQVTSLSEEKSTLEVSLNDANSTIVSLGQKEEALVAQITELTTFKNEIVDKENTSKIEAIVAEVTGQLSEEEITLINELAQTKDVEKVQFKVNELCAKKYKESLKLLNSTDHLNFFASPTQKDLDGDILSKFNM